MEWKKRQIEVIYQGVQKNNDAKERNEDSGGRNELMILVLATWIRGNGEIFKCKYSKGS